MSLGQIIADALKMADDLKGSGLSEDQFHAALEQTLRQHWPYTREWHFVCANCSDTGLEMHACDGKHGCGHPRLHRAHDYGRPCFCKLGARFQKRERAPEDAIAAAASVKKSFTKVGR